jgi:hypothetical protein
VLGHGINLNNSNVKLEKDRLLWRIFIMFLHIMVDQNPKKSNAKKITFFISYDVMLEYICAKKICVTMYWKMQIYSSKDWNDF